MLIFKRLGKLNLTVNLHFEEEKLMSVLLQYTEIEDQPIIEGRNSMKQISFRKEIVAFWKPNVPGDQYNEHSLCFDGTIEKNRIAWSEKFNGKVPFGSLCYTEQRFVLKLLGIDPDRGNSIVDWLLEQEDDVIDLLEIEPDGLRRLVSFPKTDNPEDEPANGIFYRKNRNLLCRSQAGLYLSPKWIRDKIILGEFG